MSEIKTCTRCLYGDDVPNISFDEEGVCNYCHTHDQMENEYPIGEEGEKKLKELVEKIKKAGTGRKYDCVVGVSGGCDSSFLLYQMVEYGLSPLAVHFDNTWNSTIATQNIKKLTEKLDVDLYTHVVSNREYDEIYRAFIKAGVPDIEAPTDLALAATLTHAASKFKISYIIEGHAFRTEGISPLGWLYMDARYVQSVLDEFNVPKLKTYPHFWLSKQLKWMTLSNIKKVRPLYFMDYNKEEVKTLLAEKFGWEWYGGHHLDNRFTAFYHRYFIPTRFGIDFRILGYSAMVRSGQMTREEGFREMTIPPHEGTDVLEIVELVKKRLGYSDNEFTSLMNAPKRTYHEFKTYKKTFERLRPLFWVMYKLDRIPKSFYMKFTKKT